MNTVMVFGTFDGLHAGHINFFKQAKKYGENLIIVVARDCNVLKIKNKPPKFNEKVRLLKIKISQVNDKVILGQVKNPYAIIKKEKPDIICLGYDQNSFSQKLDKMFPKIKVIRLKPFKPNIYKSSILN